MSVQVTEGFLCPICMKDLGNIYQLQNHFDETHQYEDKDILQSVKGIFGKAKKVLKFDSTTYDIDSFKDKNFNKSSNINERLPFEYHVQPLGSFVTHSNEYKKLRSERYDTYIKETNKLILRLHSLINMDNIDDINKRKEYEKTVVNWIPDNLVHNCPYCAKIFNLAHRRRHHCRLCGSVLCHKCSQFISFNAARTLIEPKHVDMDTILASPSNNSITTISEESSDMASNISKLRRSDSVSSLVSYVSPTTGQNHVRICKDCGKALSWRSQLILHNNPSTNPSIRTFTALYNEMANNVGEIRKLIPAYCAKVESLNSYGKSFYQLDQATTLRKRILRCGEKVENLSRAISVPPGNTANETDPVNANLRKGVRSFACRFLKDNFLTLPRLPDRETLKQLILESPQLQPLSKEIEVIKSEPKTEIQNFAENNVEQSSTNCNNFQDLPNNVVAQPRENISLNPFEEMDETIPDIEPLVPNGCITERVNIKMAATTAAKTQLRDEDLIPAQALAEQIENVRAYLAQSQLESDNLDETYALETNLAQLQRQLLVQKRVIAEKLSIQLEDVIL